MSSQGSPLIIQSTVHDLRKMISLGFTVYLAKYFLSVAIHVNFNAALLWIRQDILSLLPSLSMITAARTLHMLS